MAEILILVETLHSLFQGCLDSKKRNENNVKFVVILKLVKFQVTSGKIRNNCLQIDVIIFRQCREED